MVSIGQQEGPGENAFFIKNLHRHSSRMWKKVKKCEKKVPKNRHPFPNEGARDPPKVKYGANRHVIFGHFWQKVRK